MKKILMFLMLLSATSAFAQDVIVKKDGTTILSKVIEIGSSEVKYKKYSNQAGPTYTILKSEIQAINYENGEKETFSVTEVQTPQQLFGPSDYSSQMAEQLAAQNRMQRERLLGSAKSWSSGAEWCLGLGLAGGIITGLILNGEIEDNFFDNTTYLVCCGVGIGVGVCGALICYSVANNKEKAAEALSTAHLYKQDFNLGNSRLSAGIDLIKDNIRREQTVGLGLSVHF